jgi:hypothetical protein
MSSRLHRSSNSQCATFGVIVMFTGVLVANCSPGWQTPVSSRRCVKTIALPAVSYCYRAKFLRILERVLK